MQATFTGHEYDEENSLQYYGARYMDNEVGRFISIDPLLLNLDQNTIYDKLYDGQYSKDSNFNNLLVTLKAERGNLTANDTKKASFYYFLGDPQQLNSYAYVTNNPVISIDPDGETEWRQVGAGFSRIASSVGTAFIAYQAARKGAAIKNPSYGAASGIATTFTILIAEASHEFSQGINQIAYGFEDKKFETQSLAEIASTGIFGEKVGAQVKGFEDSFNITQLMYDPTADSAFKVLSTQLENNQDGGINFAPYRRNNLKIENRK